MEKLYFNSFLIILNHSVDGETILKATDWVMILTALFLGFVALFVPYLAEFIKRKLFKPIANFTFSLSPPNCHLTSWSFDSCQQNMVYYFRFLIENTGKTLLQNCENVVEEIWHYDDPDNPKKINNFTPVNLKWSGNQDKQFMNINPGKKVFCDIGYLPTIEFQRNHQDKLINISGYDNIALKFVFEFDKIYYSQLNCIPPGKFALKITTYCENHNNLNNYLEITWSGEWKEIEEDLFRELVIKKIDKIE